MNYKCYALIDLQNNYARLFPCKPIKEDNNWIAGDISMEIPINMLQKFAKDILGREMTKEDNPLDLTNYFKKTK